MDAETVTPNLQTPQETRFGGFFVDHISYMLYGSYMIAYIITIALLSAYAWMQSVILEDMDEEVERLDSDMTFGISLSITALLDGLHKRIRRQKRSAISIGLIILFLSPPQHITLILLGLFVAYETYRFNPIHFLAICVGYAEIKR